MAEELQERTAEIQRDADRSAQRRLVSSIPNARALDPPRMGGQRPASQSRRLRSRHHRDFAKQRAADASFGGDDSEGDSFSSEEDDGGRDGRFTHRTARRPGSPRDRSGRLVMVDAPVAEERVKALRERLQRSGAALPSPVASVAVGQTRSRSRSPRATSRSPRSRSRSSRGTTRSRSRSRSVSFGSPRSAGYERHGEINETSFVQRQEYSESDSDDEWDLEWQRESMRRKSGGSFTRSPRAGGRGSPVSELLAEAKRRGSGRFQV